MLGEMELQFKAEALRRNIPGLLFYIDNNFLHVLEGHEPDLRDFMATVEQDPRHDGVSYLMDARTERRSYNSWSIGDCQLRNLSVFDFDTITAITESFKKNFLPRADALIDYYCILLAQKAKNTLS